MKRLLSVFLPLFSMFVLSGHVLADADSDISFITSASKPPTGVVFEVVEGNEKALEEALQKIKKYSKQLKSAIPAIKLSVVSHGTEQFALLKENQTQYKNTHKKVRSLISDNVPVHVCATHASWYSLSEKDFPDYIDVTEAGPKKIREYQRLGYALIKIELD